MTRDTPTAKRAAGQTITFARAAKTACWPVVAGPLYRREHLLVGRYSIPARLRRMLCHSPLQWSARSIDLLGHPKGETSSGFQRSPLNRRVFSSLAPCSSVFRYPRTTFVFSGGRISAIPPSDKKLSLAVPVPEHCPDTYPDSLKHRHSWNWPPSTYLLCATFPTPEPHYLTTAQDRYRVAGRRVSNVRVWWHQVGSILTVN